MNKRDYGFYEDYILNRYKGAIDKVKNDMNSVKETSVPKESSFASQYGDSPFVGLNGMNDFGNSQGMGSQERQLSRIRTLDSGSISKPVISQVDESINNYGYVNNSSYDGHYTSSNSGSSFVLVLAAVIALVTMVLVVSFNIISRIGL